MTCIFHYIYCKIIKLPCELEENLKQNNQIPHHRKIPLWWAKSRDTICSSNNPVSFRKLLSQEKYKNNRKTDKILLKIHRNKAPPQWSNNLIFSLSRYSQKCFTWQDFVLTKVPRRGCYKTVSSSIVIRNGKVYICLCLSDNHALRNFKKIFCFPNSTVRINIVKVAMPVMMGILKLSNTDILYSLLKASIVFQVWYQ